MKSTLIQTFKDSSFANKFYYFRQDVYSYLIPYKFDATRYSGSFITQNAVDSDVDNDLSGKVDRVIYIFWTGDNELTPNRLKGIKSLEDNAGVRIQLVTPSNLSEYIVPDDPLPPAYEYLSLIHRSDYLRSYFMHHYGGGYSDIKICKHSWVRAFDAIDNSDAYIIGAPEDGRDGLALTDNYQMRRDLSRWWRLVVTNSSYICRPHTPFTAEWHNEAKRRLNLYYDSLKEHPALDPFGSNVDYPIPWVNILGEIFHPLCLKYHDKVLKSKDLVLQYWDYR